MRSFRSYYRTSDGSADYRFTFEEQSDGTWRAYIEEQPPTVAGRPTPTPLIDCPKGAASTSAGQGTSIP